WTQSANRRRGLDSSRQGGAFQTRQGVAVDRLSAAGSLLRSLLWGPSRDHLPFGIPMSEPTLPVSSTQEYYRPVDVYVVRPAKPLYWLHAILLMATFFTTLVVGARMQNNFLHNQPVFSTADDSLDIFPLRWALQGSHLWLGVPFSFTLMMILLAHEMGHYLYCRRYQVAATLPFFIPFPTLIGTLGAFIRIRSPIRSRAELFDIGIAGPI